MRSIDELFGQFVAPLASPSAIGSITAILLLDVIPLGTCCVVVIDLRVAFLDRVPRICLYQDQIPPDLHIRRYQSMCIRKQSCGHAASRPTISSMLQTWLETPASIAGVTRRVW